MGESQQAISPVMVFEGDRIMQKKSLAARFFSVLLAHGIIVVLAPGIYAYQGPISPTPPTHGRPATAAKAANETYAVVQVGEDIKVVSSSEKATLKKKADEDYKADLKKYNEDKKGKNNHDTSASKKPDKKDYDIKVLKASFKTQEEAQKFADEKIKEREKGGTKKTTAANENW